MTSYKNIVGAQEFFAVLENASYVNQEAKETIRSSVVRVCDHILDKYMGQGLQNDDLFVEEVSLAMWTDRTLQCDAFGMVWSQYFKEYYGCDCCDCCE